MAVQVSLGTMKIFNKNKGVLGSGIASERGIRFRYMIQEEAKRRARILDFWKKYGLEATKEAFTVGERTLFRWQEKLEKKEGKLEALNNQSRAPQNRRTRRTPLYSKRGLYNYEHFILVLVNQRLPHYLRKKDIRLLNQP